MWSGSASDLLRLCAESAREDTSMDLPWAKNPRALAGRLRRAQTFLRMLDIEIAFGREGRSGARMIRMSALGPSRSRAVGMDWEGPAEREVSRKRGRMISSDRRNSTADEVASIVSIVRVIRSEGAKKKKKKGRRC